MTASMVGGGDGDGGVRFGGGNSIFVDHRSGVESILYRNEMGWEKRELTSIFW